ncbi:MAG: hypothetical protein ACLRP3_03960 [Escherichia sp.]
MMQGFIRFHIRCGCVVHHRAAVIYCHSDGLDPTRILVMSQVLLSLVSPGAGSC